MTENKTYINVTASANVGLGLWTSICYSLCQILGKPSKAYQAKLEQLEKAVMAGLEAKCRELGGSHLVDVQVSLFLLSAVATAKVVKVETAE